MNPASPDLSERIGFWHRYFHSVQSQHHSWLDLSNERVHAQTLHLALEGAGPVNHRKCLDVGCGTGLLSIMLKDLSADSVTAVDQVDALIARNGSRHSDIEWKVASLDDFETRKSFDLVFLIEVLQYVEYKSAIEKYWQMLRSGGRLVTIHPVAECPIVQRTITRFGGNYRAPRLCDVTDIAAILPNLKGWGIRGLFFQDDQLITPYFASPWTGRPAWPSPPNRAQAVFVKR